MLNCGYSERAPLLRAFPRRTYRYSKLQEVEDPISKASKCPMRNALSVDSKLLVCHNTCVCIRMAYSTAWHSSKRGVKGRPVIGR